MKISDPELALLRTYPQNSRVYLGVERGVTILSARVDGHHDEGATEIQLKDVAFADGFDAGDLLKGMTVALHSVAGNNRRVDAAFLAYDGGTDILTISENVRQCDDNFYVTVYSSMKLWRLDDDSFDTQQHYPPFAIAGGMRAGFVDEPLSFLGANSYHPLGRTLASPLWKFFDDATLESGSLSALGTVDDPNIVSWASAGEKLFRFRIDDSEGERARTFAPVLIFERDGDNAPYAEFVTRGLKWNGAGWSCDFTVYGTADTTEFPPQARIVVWSENWYGDTKANIGGALRGMGEKEFEGWIRPETITANADEKSVSFTAETTEALFRKHLPNLTLRDGDDVTDADTFAGLDVTKAVLRVIRQTTLSAIADVFLALFEYPLDPLVDIASGTMQAQIAQSLISKFGYIAGSRFGSVTIGRNRNLLTAEMRAGLKGSAIRFTPQDWLDVQVERVRGGSVARAHLEGKTGDDTPIAADYPVSGFASNGDTIEDMGWLFKDQAQADELAELVYRRENRGVKGITLRLPNYCVLEPAFQEFFSVQLLSAFNNRGINWDERHFQCTDMQIDFGEGYKTVTLRGEASRFTGGEEAWAPDPSQVPQYVYGYDQNLGMDTGTDDPFDSVVDSADDFIVDSADRFVIVA